MCGIKSVGVCLYVSLGVFICVCSGVYFCECVCKFDEPFGVCVCVRVHAHAHACVCVVVVSLLCLAPSSISMTVVTKQWAPGVKGRRCDVSASAVHQCFVLCYTTLPLIHRFPLGAQSKQARAAGH